MSLLVDLVLWLTLGAIVALAASLFWVGFAHLRYASYYRGRSEVPPSRGTAGWPMIYLRILNSIVVLAWWHFRAAFQGALRMPAGGGSGGPVLCVHGFHMNSTCMRGIRRALERRGRPTQSVFLGFPYRSPQVYAAALEVPLRELVERFPDQHVDLVAHSMGGLVSRLVLSENPELAAQVGKIVTLASPHHGTALLRWIRYGPVYSMMSRSSDFVRRLPDFRESAPQARVVTVAAVPDFVVYPEESAYLSGARAVTIRGVGHSGLLIEPRVIELVADFLAGETAPDSEEPLDVLL